MSNMLIMFVISLAKLSLKTLISRKKSSPSMSECSSCLREVSRFTHAVFKPSSIAELNFPRLKKIFFHTLQIVQTSPKKII